MISLSDTVQTEMTGIIQTEMGDQVFFMGIGTLWLALREYAVQIDATLGSGTSTRLFF